MTIEEIDNYNKQRGNYSVDQRIFSERKREKWFWKKIDLGEGLEENSTIFMLGERGRQKASMI